MKNKNILICGAGIAGLTLAYWLKRYGFDPVVIEKAPHQRTGGYMIDFFGNGVDVAERMQLLPALKVADMPLDEVTFVDETNKRVGGFNVREFKKLFNHRAFNILRSSLANIILEHVKDEVPIIYNKTITKTHDPGKCLEVTYNDEATAQHDLLIGADGLHSVVRKFLYPLENAVLKSFGYYTASYTIPKFPQYDKRYLSYTVPGKQVGVYPVDDHRAATFFIFRSSSKITIDHRDVDAQKQLLCEQFADMGWKTSALLEHLYQTDDFYFDSVSQVRLARWFSDRICLTGDACYSPSLLSGQGATLAMTGAYVLAGELKAASGDASIAFQRYHHIMKPLVDRKQKLGEAFADSFVPKNRLSLFGRNAFTNVMFLPFVSRYFVNLFTKGNLLLKHY